MNGCWSRAPLLQTRGLDQSDVCVRDHSDRGAAPQLNNHSNNATTTSTDTWRAL
ncbi:hypothetical protein ZHAS_00005975 [Anopheles sinensis]|uniref:Uncharacterized protein n=1 Tax=Anopheles sinensis TaxID=74873 RepID=A0A084VKV5_ANOSI|nr:hypothetical protein ZHAS_00005975 [Anopheles sinensis]